MGKLAPECNFVKVHSDVSLVLPIIVAGTFVRNFKLSRGVEEADSEVKE